MATISTKSNRELAFLHDLFVATDWGERFSSLVDEQVELPEKGEALYLVCGTGGHAVALQEQAGEELKFIGVDENHEYIELARAKAMATDLPAEFSQGQVDSLSFAENRFDLVVGDASLIAPRRVSRMLEEMIRVAKAASTVAFYLPTASSFGEFFSIYWEALHNCGLIDHEADVEHLITELPTTSQVKEFAQTSGLEDVLSSTRIEEFDYESGEAFLKSPLISDFLMLGWLNSVPKESQELVAGEIARIINEERHEAEFALTVKATLIVGRKSRSN
ncbi:MAG TPA: class I SAM-dependent methyltransferase [Pyrinomonadaceae bacterium]|nr:class I SAM-dependent methyltransferase [Pyrinomonadaceae bacterium]